jgi:hypothetical protein
MTVYFAQQAGDTAGPVKIGFSSDMKARIKNLSVASVGGITILATISGGKETEAYLHEKFEASRVSGEWFSMTDELVDLIERAKAGKAFIPAINDTAKYMVRKQAEYAVSQAKVMALDILDREFRGVGDTIDSAMSRVEMRTGFPAKLLHRLRYRDLNDIPSGQYFHLCEVWEHICCPAGKEAARPVK